MIRRQINGGDSMRRLLAFLAAMLVVWPAFVYAKPSSIEGSTSSTRNSTSIKFSIGDTSDSDAIAVSGFCSVRYQQAGGDDAALYAVPTAATAATSGTLIGTFTSSTTTATTFTAGTRWVKAVATDATVGGSVMVIDCSPLTGGGGGGGSRFDHDGDGLYDVAYLWDADGDGSVWETCTAKDVPDPACKASGERVYRDVADDINCALWGCGSGQMELTGALLLEPGVYVNWPCWDAQEGSGFNDPTAANDNLHDSTSDAAWNDCPATPDPDTTRRFHVISLMDWQGEIIGSGVDTRNPATTASYKRDQGTYLVDDRGPSWESGTNSGNNNWFGQASFIRGITFGFQGAHTASTSAVVASGESAGDGDSKGYGTISGTQTIGNIEDNGYVCVANTSGLNTLDSGDLILFYGQSGTLGGGSPTVAFAARVRDGSPGTCNAGAGIQIPLGGFYGHLGDNQSYAAGSVPYAYTFLNGNAVTAPRSDYFDSTAKISNMNIEPQDWWAEPSGDCPEQLDFADSGERPWTIALDGDSTNADIDCDTNPLIGLYGGGAPVVENVVIRNWHQYAIDGDSNAGFPLIRRVRFLYGKGGPIVDAGTGWRMHDLEIRDTSFATQGISTYGPGLEGRDIRAINSSGEQLINFTDVSVGNLFENIKIEGGSIMHALKFTCGARRNTVRNLTLEGTLGIGTGLFSSRQGTVAYFECSDTTVPIEQNVIDGFDTTGTRMAQQFTGNVTAAVALNTLATIAAPKSTAIVRNHFTNGRMKATKSAYDACLFAAIDTDTTGSPGRGAATNDYSHEDVLALNSFMGNSVESTGGGGGVAHVYCGCNVNTAGGGGTSYATCSATVGSGSSLNGANARGCLNFDGTAAPSPGETCS